MQVVHIEKDRLKEVLTNNRTNHREIFLKAQDKYRELAIEELDKMLKEARAGKRIKRNVSLVEPLDYTKEYDRVLEQLDFEVEEVIKLSATEFKQYVQDDWGWSDQFNTTSDQLINA